MDLSKVVSGEKTTFSAIIYKGHFERDGQMLGSVQVHVEKIIFSAKLNGQGAPTDNKYFVFGENGEYFAAHLIQGKPNFDAILSVSHPYQFNELICNRRYCPGSHLVPIRDSQLPITLSPELGKDIPLPGESLGQFGGILADTKKVIYFEQGDLAK
ncbi:MAG: hypothetical protein COT73_02980 [Bdellovibrio sp. CG10_big_fil_rev_8_21_14_0_10_47_8]|nr:MAG: hypothetical protein COT73_02980 [Bdellovibrio sp. CG10_big_fil_rev_8_21_14_0_10_47_8]